MHITSFNDMPKNAVNKTIPAAIGNFPDKVGFFTPTFQDLINWCMTGKIIPYKNNRAGVPEKDKGKLVRDEGGVVERAAFIAPGTLKSVVEDFSPLSFGQLSLALLSDSRLMYSEGESRTVGLLHKWWKGTFPAEFLTHQFSMQVIPEHAHREDYIRRGRQSAHTTKQRVNNPDLAFGHIINNELYPLLDDDTVLFFTNTAKLSNILSYLIYTLVKLPKKDWDFTDMYWLGKAEAKQFFNSAAGEIVLKDKDLQSLATAMASYVGYYKATQALAGEHLDVRPLFADNGWCGLYLTDRITDAKQLSTDNVLAKQTLKNYVDCKESAPLLGGTTSKAKIERRCNTIFKALKRKRRNAA